MNEVMRNASTFLELIQAAKTESAGCWNEEALQRAMQWALYFEGVHRKLSAKPGVVTQFNRGLQIISSKPGAAPGPSPITFDQLQESRRLLMKILLQNPYIDGALYTLVLDQYNQLPANKDGRTGTELLNEDATECAHAKAVRNTLLKMKKLTSEAVARTKPTRDQVDNSQLCEPCEAEVHTNAIILHKHLVHHLSGGPPSESMHDYLHQTLHQLAQKPEGMKLILNMASSLHQEHDMEGLDADQGQMKTEESRMCEPFVRDWLAENRTKYEDKKNRFKIDPSGSKT